MDVIDPTVAVVIDSIVGHLPWIDPNVPLQVRVTHIDPLVDHRHDHLARSDITITPSLFGSAAKGVGRSRTAEGRRRVVAISTPKLTIGVKRIIADRSLLQNPIRLSTQNAWQLLILLSHRHDVFARRNPQASDLRCIKPNRINLLKNLDPTLLVRRHQTWRHNRFVLNDQLTGHEISGHEIRCHQTANLQTLHYEPSEGTFYNLESSHRGILQSHFLTRHSCVLGLGQRPERSQDLRFASFLSQYAPKLSNADQVNDDIVSKCHTSR